MPFRNSETMAETSVWEFGIRRFGILSQPFRNSELARQDLSSGGLNAQRLRYQLDGALTVF